MATFCSTRVPVYDESSLCSLPLSPPLGTRRCERVCVCALDRCPGRGLRYRRHQSVDVEHVHSKRVRCLSVPRARYRPVHEAKVYNHQRPLELICITPRRYQQIVAAVRRQWPNCVRIPSAQFLKFGFASGRTRSSRPTGQGELVGEINVCEAW